jgi:DNA repair protein RecO (recombination protein O)
MYIKTEAIVLSSIRYNEADLIVKCYTHSHGLLSFMVKGVLKSKKGKLKASLFQTLSLLFIETRINTKGQLNYFKDIQISNQLNHLQTNIYKATLAMFTAEILNTVIYEEEKNEGLFDFIKTSIVWLDKAENFKNFHLSFLIKLTSFLGFYPQSNQHEHEIYFNIQEGCFELFESKFCLNQYYSSIFQNLISQSLEEFQQQQIPKTLRLKLLDVIMTYYELHIDSFRRPKSLDVIKNIFAS